MLANLIEGFKKSYEMYGDDFISDQHKLDAGLYIRVEPDGSLTSHIIEKNKDEIPVDDTYKWFQRRDFISKYLESNKAILTEPIKRVHSNNYLTWFVKKDSLIGTDKTLSKEQLMGLNASYYESLVGDKLNNKEILKMLDGDFDETVYAYCKAFICQNYAAIKSEILKHDEEFTFYVKVFFDFDYELYKRESNRYFYHKIFNSDAYNIDVDGNLYGLSNFNMGLNTKKPYLEHKTMRRNTPYMVSLEEALLGYKYSLYLKNHGYGARFQTMGEMLKGQLEQNMVNSMESQNLIYLEQDNGSVIIKDYDIIPAYDNKSDYKTENHLGISRKDSETGIIKVKSYELEPLDHKTNLEVSIDKYLFLGQLTRNYFVEGKELKPSKFITKIQIELLLQSRNLLFDYFYKGMVGNLKVFIDKYGLFLVIEALEKGKGVDAFNVYYSVKNYCKGEAQVNSIQMYKAQIKTLIEGEDEQYIENPELYSFAAGQLAYFLLSRSGASKKNHDVIEPFLNRRTVGQLNEELTYWFKRYAHDIGMNFKKFNRLYAALLAFDKSITKVDDVFLAGYLSNNLLYEKREVLENE